MGTLEALRAEIHSGNELRWHNDALHNVIDRAKNRICDLLPDSRLVISRAPHNEREREFESMSDIVRQNADVDDMQFVCREGDGTMSEEVQVYGAPYVQRIQIKGSFWNKTAKAIICYRGRKYSRKLADFEWLRNVMFHNDPNRAI